ncbi:hypothetical protein [Quadrisphaera sp. INWT6]|uniref:hypothetical protein n=1 Tax=Quadrisphaera sp. INWT6 TaxID=2596917 RepID=UPI001891F70A|nr:hypothetical protein [Quadrisphaera sp. INWT6]
MPEVHSHYFGLLAARLIARLAPEGLRVVVEQTGASREGELAAITASRVSAYDGLVLSAVGLDPDDVLAIAGDLPVVVLGERQDVRRFDHVEMANTDGAAAAGAPAPRPRVPPAGGARHARPGRPPRGRRRRAPPPGARPPR